MAGMKITYRRILQFAGVFVLSVLLLVACGDAGGRKQESASSQENSVTTDTTKEDAVNAGDTVTGKQESDASEERSADTTDTQIAAESLAAFLLESDEIKDILMRFAIAMNSANHVESDAPPRDSYTRDDLEEIADNELGDRLFRMCFKTQEEVPGAVYDGRIYKIYEYNFRTENPEKEVHEDYVAYCELDEALTKLWETQMCGLLSGDVSFSKLGPIDSEDVVETGSYYEENKLKVLFINVGMQPLYDTCDRYEVNVEDGVVVVYMEPVHPNGSGGPGVERFHYPMRFVFEAAENEAGYLLQEITWLSQTGIPESELTGGQSFSGASDILALYAETKKKDQEITARLQAGASGMMGMREDASEQYVLWDTFLNKLLSHLEETLSENEWNELKMEQQAWEIEKDAKAEAEAAEVEGGTAYPLTLTLALTDEIIARVEILMARYI